MLDSIAYSFPLSFPSSSSNVESVPLISFFPPHRARHVLISVFSHALGERKRECSETEREAQRRRRHRRFFSLANDTNSRAVLLLLKRGGLLVIP